MRNNKLQERQKHDQAAYFAKADKGNPCPAKQNNRKVVTIDDQAIRQVSVRKSALTQGR